MRPRSVGRSGSPAIVTRSVAGAYPSRLTVTRNWPGARSASVKAPSASLVARRGPVVAEQRDPRALEPLPPAAPGHRAGRLEGGAHRRAAVLRRGVDLLDARGLAGAHKAYPERQAGGVGQQRVAVVVREQRLAERDGHVEREHAHLHAIERVAAIVGDVDGHRLAHLREDDLDLLAVALRDLDDERAPRRRPGDSARETETSTSVGDRGEGERAVVRGVRHLRSSEPAVGGQLDARAGDRLGGPPRGRGPRAGRPGASPRARGLRRPGCRVTISLGASTYSGCRTIGVDAPGGDGLGPERAVGARDPRVARTGTQAVGRTAPSPCGRSGMGPGMTPSSPAGISGAGPGRARSNCSSRNSTSRWSRRWASSASAPTTSIVAPASRVAAVVDDLADRRAAAEQGDADLGGALADLHGVPRHEAGRQGRGARVSRARSGLSVTDPSSPVRPYRGNVPRGSVLDQHHARAPFTGRRALAVAVGHEEAHVAAGPEDELHLPALAAPHGTASAVALTAAPRRALRSYAPSGGAPAILAAPVASVVVPARWPEPRAGGEHGRAACGVPGPASTTRTGERAEADPCGA